MVAPTQPGEKETTFHWLRRVILALFVITAAGCSTVPSRSSARAPATPAGAVAAVAFEHVNVVDVTNGHVRRDQTAIVTGTHIAAVGPAHTVQLPAGTQRIEARGKYLIPGLWDMHAHPINHMDFAYPLYLANGVTGIRNASTWVAIDNMRRWQQEILAGRRVGPPRQLLTGPSLDQSTADMVDPPDSPNRHVATPAAARRAVDSLGTVARGKLADLVLLDANPLVDIHNTTKIRAVVANGHYFDRAQLDALLATVEQAGDRRWR